MCCRIEDDNDTFLYVCLCIYIYIYHRHTRAMHWHAAVQRRAAPCYGPHSAPCKWKMDCDFPGFPLSETLPQTHQMRWRLTSWVVHRIPASAEESWFVCTFGPIKNSPAQPWALQWPLETPPTYGQPWQPARKESPLDVLRKKSYGKSRQTALELGFF